MSEGSFDPAERAAAGVEIRNERGEVGEGRVAAEDEDFSAETAKLGDGVLDEGLACERQESLVRAHAGAEAAGEDIAGDRMPREDVAHPAATLVRKRMMD